MSARAEPIRIMESASAAAKRNRFQDVRERMTRKMDGDARRA